MNTRKIKNTARRFLGEKTYYKISRILFPREILPAYGERNILTENAQINSFIRETLDLSKPASLAKLGAVELRFCQEYLNGADGKNKKYSSTSLEEIYINAGVFPQTSKALNRFASIFIQACEQVSHLAVWYRPGEQEFVLTKMPAAHLFRLSGLDPLPFGSRSWLQGLHAKRVLVVSPFVRSIQEQYNRRESVWNRCPGFLPTFDLHTVKAPLSAGLVQPNQPDWETTLNTLIAAMDNQKYDIALIGAGAFSIPLAVHAQKKGAIGIHLGGQLQILFGVMGGRWEENEALNQYVNEYWVRPSGDEVPDNKHKVEGGCYW